MNVCGHEVKIFGSFVRIAVLSADTYEFIDDPEAALKEIRESGERIDLFTFMQRVPDTSPKYQYPMEWDNLAVLSVSTYEQWWKEQIGFKARNKAKQAEKNGVAIREVPFDDRLVEGIWKIYNECEIRQGKRYPHYGKDLATVHKMSETFLDRSAYLGAYFEGQLIGFAKLHCDATRTQAGLTHLLSLMAHRDKSPTNALVAHAVRYCAEHKIPYLVYSRFKDGKKQWDSLMEFKERNGFKQVNLPRYYVPVSTRGLVAYRLGLHKRLIDHLPEPILAKLRLMRNNWYARKLQTTAE